MSKQCQITGRGPQSGNTVSHAHNKSHRRWEPNLQRKRIWDAESGRFIKLRISMRGLRTIQKLGLKKAMQSGRK